MPENVCAVVSLPPKFTPNSPAPAAVGQGAREVTVKSLNRSDAASPGRSHGQPGLEALRGKAAGPLSPHRAVLSGRPLGHAWPLSLPQTPPQDAVLDETELEAPPELSLKTGVRPHTPPPDQDTSPPVPRPAASVKCHVGRRLNSFIPSNLMIQPVASPLHGVLEALQFSPVAQARLGASGRERLSPQEMRWALARRATARLAEYNALPRGEQAVRLSQDPALAELNQAMEPGLVDMTLSRLDYIKARGQVESDQFRKLVPHQQVRVLALACKPESRPERQEDPVSPEVVASLLDLRLRTLEESRSGEEGAQETMVLEEVHEGRCHGEAEEALMVRGAGGRMELVVPRHPRGGGGPGR